MDVLLKKVKYVSTALCKFLSQNTLCRLLVAKKHFYKKAKVRRGTRFLIKLSGIRYVHSTALFRFLASHFNK